MMRGFAIATLFAGAVVGTSLAAEPPRPPKGPGPLETSCVSCHSELDGSALEPTKHTAEDIHFAKGLSCHDCHGGNPTAGFDGDPFAAHDESKGWTGKPARRSIPNFCARCHSDAAFMKRFNPAVRVDQLSEYRTSVHGRRQAAGDDKVAVCVDCHGVHGIHAVSDPLSRVHPTHLAGTCGHCHSNADLMKQYGRPANQESDYRTSVHAHALYEKGDTSAPTCNDCHGSHGAAPPGVQSVANVCGSCHGREGSLFREIEAKRKLDLEACIQCVICHGNHAIPPPTDEMVGVGPKSTCTGCHADGEAGYKAAAQMSDLIVKLAARLGDAERVLNDAGRAGVEVGPDLFALRKARDNLVEARVLVHSFDIERFTGITNEGIATADAGVAAGQRAFAELRFRRVGLSFSLVVIFAVIVSLVLVIRRMEG